MLKPLYQCKMILDFVKTSYSTNQEIVIQSVFFAKFFS
jgi:hypothetical protein